MINSPTLPLVDGSKSPSEFRTNRKSVSIAKSPDGEGSMGQSIEVDNPAYLMSVE